MTNWPVLDVAIGLAFLYFILSLVCSSANEAIASVINLRARTLEQWIAGVVADPAALHELEKQLTDLSTAAHVTPLVTAVSAAIAAANGDLAAAKTNVQAKIAAVKIPAGLATALNAAMADALSVEDLGTKIDAALAEEQTPDAKKANVAAALSTSPASALAPAAATAADPGALGDVIAKAIPSMTEGRKAEIRRAATASFYHDPIIQAASKRPKRLTTDPTTRVKRPAYLPASSAIAVFLKQASNGKVNDAEFEQIVANLPPQLRDVADAYASEIKGDVEALRKRLETFFDDSMERVSGWYKRRVQLILALLSVLVAFGLNADTLVIGEGLWKDPTVRAVVVAQASTTVGAGTKAQAVPKPITDELSDVNALNLPLGWTHTTTGKDKKSHQTWNWPSSRHGWVAKFVGLLITVFALMLGAPFWFDLLSQFVRLRNTGPVPATTAEKDKTDRVDR